jgi:hypothetical protein
METNQESACSGTASLGRQRCSTGIILLGLILFLAACTYLSPISDDAKTLQEQIRTGQAVHQGDRVRVVTHDGVSHRLIVVSVEDDVLKGQLNIPIPAFYETDEPDAQEPEQKKQPLMEIPIADIVLVEKEKLSTGKTAAVTGGVLLVFLALSAAAAFAAVMTP